MIELRTLGGFAVRDSARGHDLTLAPRPAALLVYLAVSRPRGRVPRDRLTGVFWPELPDARARAALSQTLYRLRVELGRDVVATAGDVDVELPRAEVQCDAVDFEDELDRGTAEQALRLYGGDLLAGFHLSGAAEFEQWLEAERARLKNRAVAAACQLAVFERDCGRPQGALTWFHRASKLAPYDEQIMRDLIRALAAAGDVAGAVREYDAFAALIARDLELAPSTQSASLIRAIRSLRDDAHSSDQAPLDDIASAASRRILRPASEPNASLEGTVAPPDLPRDGIGSRALAAFSSARRRAIGFAALLVLALLPAFAASPKLRERLTRTMLHIPPFGSSANLRSNRVLVLPLAVPEGDLRLKTVSRMAADWLAQGLQRTGFVEVIDPSTASVLFADVDSMSVGALRGLAEGSRARIIVWGSVYPEGDTIRFQVQVIDARDGTVLRALDPVSGDLSRISETLGLLRAKVAGALATVTDERLAALVPTSGAPPTFEAYQEFARGLDAFRQPWNQAYDHFQRAAQLDSSFTLASFWAALALFNGARFAEHDSLIRALATRRDQLPPADQAGLDMFSAQQRADWDAALTAARRAAQLAPQSQWAYMAALNAWRLGRPREALNYLETQDPERGWPRASPMWWTLRMNTLHQLGRFEEQLALARRARALFASEGPRVLSIDRMEIFALAALGRTEEIDSLLEDVLATVSPANKVMARDFHLFTGQELRAHSNAAAARRYFERCVALSRDPRCLYELGNYQEILALVTDSSGPAVSAALAHLGRFEDAKRLQAAYRARYNQGPAYTYGITFNDARMALLTGDRARALEVLRSEPQRGRLWEMVHWSGDFELLRDQKMIDRLLSKY